MRINLAHSLLRSSVFVLDMENIVPDPFASFCKLLLLDDKEWEKAREKSKPPKPRLDVLTLPIAIHVLESRLQKYSTTLQVIRFHSPDS